MAGRRLGFGRRAAVSVVKSALFLMTKREWRGMENIPSYGPLIIVANHISHADPLVLAHFVYDAGRWPAFLAKASLFAGRVRGSFMRHVRQIPVYRGTAEAGRALDAAIAALADGECVVVYPEGTTTREPDLWPMRGKTGVARLWLATGAPIVPIVMWGPQKIFDPRVRKLSLRPRRPVKVVAGPPIDLSKWSRPEGTARGQRDEAIMAQEITDHVMLTLRDMLAEIRGGPPPPLWSPTPAKPEADGRESGNEV